MNAHAHDPGGKVMMNLDESVIGNAMFTGPGDCYRLWLTRQWHGRRAWESLPPNFALWIGLNPSTANATHNDPTINREIDFSMGWDHDGLVKVNVCDFRSTKPEGLLAPGVVPRSPTNLAVIRSMAKEAKTIICAWGALDRRLVHFAIDVETALRADGHQLWALGLTANGSPRHPLYVKGDTPLVEFEELRI